MYFGSDYRWVFNTGFKIMLGFAAIGVLAIITGIGYGLYWLATHITITL